MPSRKPEWLKVRPPGGETYASVKSLLGSLHLHTVCEEAKCPNCAECWGSGTATIMILGDTCTRGCRFCAVESGNPGGKLDQGEPEHVASAVSQMRLNYVVLTSVARDDLPDGGAGHYAETIRAIKESNPKTLVEALIPDFQGKKTAIAKVVDAGPEVIGHNIETVQTLTPKVRDRRSSYRGSIEVLRTVKDIDSRAITKSSLMLGLGERQGEVRQALSDLREARVDALTIGQYLRPSEWHTPVADYVPPEKFEEYRRDADSMGFLYVASGPLVRSSYRASEYFMAALARKKGMVIDGG